MAAQFQPREYGAGMGDFEEEEHEESMRISYEDPTSRAARLRIMAQLSKSTTTTTTTMDEGGGGILEEKNVVAPVLQEETAAANLNGNDEDDEPPLKRVRKTRRKR
jgi:hypothetical protein